MIAVSADADRSSLGRVPSAACAAGADATAAASVWTAGQCRLHRGGPQRASGPCWSARPGPRRSPPLSRRDQRRDADQGPALRHPVELLVVQRTSRPASASAPRPAPRRARAALVQVVDEEVRGRAPCAARPARRSPSRRPARAPPPAGHRPGRRAPASRRTCPGGAPAGRRPSPSPAPAAARARSTSGSAQHRRRAWSSRRSTSASPSSRTPAQLVDAAEVDQRARRGEPQPQQRDQALAAGEHLGVLAGRRAAPTPLRPRWTARVVERRRDHAAPPAGRRGWPARPARACTASRCR